MRGTQYTAFEALNPFFEIALKGLGGLVDGKHFFDAIGDDAEIEFLYDFPGWPRTIHGRSTLMQLYSGYGGSIKLRCANHLVAHRCDDGRTVVLEYEVHGTILRTGAAYDNRFVSIVTIEGRKIVHWRDYMDSLAAWNALTAASIDASSPQAERGVT